jgi:hypothetical protein
VAVEEPPDRTDPRLFAGAHRADGAGSPGPVGLLQTTITHASLAATGSDPCVRRTQVLLCFVHCWHAVGTAAAKVYFVCSFRKEECCSMRVHLDRKRLDGDAIAFVVITLLIVIAFAY